MDLGEDVLRSPVNFPLDLSIAHSLYWKKADLLEKAKQQQQQTTTTICVSWVFASNLVGESSKSVAEKTTLV